MEEAMDKEWRSLSEEILSGMKEWRLAHPKATFRKIEQEASERVSRLQARMVQDAALASPTTDWQSLPQEERPTCPHCGKALTPRGKRKRRMQESGGCEVELRRSYGTCSSCGMGLSPLDEELALLPGSLTPIQEEHLVRLATWMPFARAAELLENLTGVFVSEATIRRHTEKVGQAYVEVQTQQIQASVPVTDRATPVPEKLAMSSDGAYVSLLHQQWAEVRTLVIGKVKKNHKEVHTRHLSSFSRMIDAATFIERAEVETRRRQILEAKEVSAVTDGAPWLQELVDLHRPDAIRI